MSDVIHSGIRSGDLAIWPIWAGYGRIEGVILTGGETFDMPDGAVRLTAFWTLRSDYTVLYDTDSGDEFERKANGNNIELWTRQVNWSAVLESYMFCAAHIKRLAFRAYLTHNKLCVIYNVWFGLLAAYS